MEEEQPLEQVLALLDQLSPAERTQLSTALGTASTSSPSTGSTNTTSNSGGENVSSNQNASSSGQASGSGDGHPGSGGFPRLSSHFTGETSSKNGVCYEIWRQEVMALLSAGVFREVDLMIAVRKSLGGMAAQVLLHLEPGASVAELVTKMDNIFGNVLPLEVILEQFWSAKQKDSESVSAWSCRLQLMVSQVRSRDPSIFPSDNQTMLRTKFWSGLREEWMKMALRYLMDTDSSYAKLLTEARVVEAEPSMQASSNQAIALDTSQKKQFDRMFSMLESLDTRMSTVEGQLKQGLKPHGAGAPTEFKKRPESTMATKKQKPFKGQCYQCKQFGHMKRDCPLNC